MAQSLRHWTSEAIDPEMHPHPGLSRFNRVVVVAILTLIASAILETEVHFIATFGGLMVWLKTGLFLFFLAEYGARLWVASLNPRYRSAWHYARTPTALLDLAAMASLAVPYVGLESTIFRLLQIARILRLARIGRFSRAMNLLAEAIRSRQVELVLSFGMALSLMLGSATLLYLVERHAQPEAFGSIPRAMWWAVETLTTVGYGDVVPITGLGKLLAAITALCGIGIIALPTGVLAGAFSDAIRHARDEGAHRHHDGAP